MINWQKNYQDAVELSRKAFAIIQSQLAEINRLNMRVAELEAAQHNVQADKCPCCLGKGKVEDNFKLVECWVCDGTGIRR
jgi:hypothetical protein